MFSKINLSNCFISSQATPPEMYFPAFVLVTALLRGAWSQSPVPVQFTTSPVLAKSGVAVVLSVQTISDVLYMTWMTASGKDVGLWSTNGAVVNSDYQGRFTLSATQLQISVVQLRDAGNYTVTVVPQDTTGYSQNSRSVELNVFDAVAGVSITVPSVVIEGKNMTLLCSWTAGTQTTISWGKGTSALPSDPRLTVSGNALVISSARRTDAGEYTCTVSNPISAQTARANITVYYGPDTPTLTKQSTAECVGGGDAVVGQSVIITCISSSLPPAVLSWQKDNSPIAISQTNSGVLTVQVLSSNQSGQYICKARNSVTGGTSQQEIHLAVVAVCLSGGAVAGIVIACFIALVIIIIVIILLVRQRNVCQRLTAEQSKILPPPVEACRQNAIEVALNETNNCQPNNLTTNRQSLTQNKNYVLQQRGLHNSITQLQNTVNGTIFSRQGNNLFTLNDTQNSPSFADQPNPNILIQTGHSHFGAMPPTVHVNLNPVPYNAQQNSSMQPQTVHLNLNTYPPGTSQQNFTAQHQNYMTLNALSNPNPNFHQNNLIQTECSHVYPQFHTEVTQSGGPWGNNSFTNEQQLQGGVALAQLERHNANIQPHSDPLVTQSLNPGTITYPSKSPEPTPDNILCHQQRPWDLLHGTPAYPGPHRDRVVDDSSTESQSSNWEPRLSQENHLPHMNNKRGILRHASYRNKLHPVDVDLNLRSQLHTQRERQAAHNLQVISNHNTSLQTNQMLSGAPLTIAPQPSMAQTMLRATPQATHISINHLNNQPPKLSHALQPVQLANTQRRPEQSKIAVQEHTSHTTFARHNQQTLPNNQSQTSPQVQGQIEMQPPPPHTNALLPRKANAAGQHPPTPPPVLQAFQFQLLPRERIQQPRANAVRVPKHTRQGHRIHAIHRDIRHRHAVLGNLHMHAHLHRHANGQRLQPLHRTQLHGARQRP
uniref:Ig-like domain-containing protein n=2 Tax=Denticeps clupeoides TaxID=299321 RepID=A0AAY4A9Z3_9TELE